MGFPVMFGAPTLNMPGVYQYDVPVTIGSTGSAATWIGYGVTLTRPTSTTMKFTFPQVYKHLLSFLVGLFPASSSSQINWIVTTDNTAVDGTLTLTSVSGGSASAASNGDVFLFSFRFTSDKLADGFTGSAT